MQATEEEQTQWVLAGLEKKYQEMFVALSHRTPILNGENERFEMLRIQHWKLVAQPLCSWLDPFSSFPKNVTHVPSSVQASLWMLLELPRKDLLSPAAARPLWDLL